MDLAAYGLGQTDKFKGTGVFSAIEFERTPDIDGDQGSSTTSDPGKQASSAKPAKAGDTANKSS